MPVTVVIPCYNAARHLPETLAAVAAQTHAASEVLVVNDGSRDATADIARRAGARVIETGGNRGAAAARNAGIDAARTDLVAFIDADDLWTADHLAASVALLEAFPEAQLAFSRIQKFGTPAYDDRPTPWLSPVVCEAGRPVELLGRLIRANCVSQCTVVARRSALERVGGYDVSMRYSEDYDLWMRMAANGPFIFQERVTSLYRVHAAQATAGADAMLGRASWAARGRALARLRDGGDHQLLATLVPDLASLYATELRVAWRSGDRAWFDALLDARGEVPGCDAIARRWEWPRMAIGGVAATRRALGASRRLAARLRGNMDRTALETQE